MNKNSFVLYGHILHTPTPKAFAVSENSYLVCENGLCGGIFESLPEKYNSLPLYSYENRLIIPALYDLHLHAPQYAFRGLGMDKELIEWLNAHAFAEELRYGDEEYAAKAYEIFAEDLKASAVARAVVFGTVHANSTLLLMEKLEQTGLCCFVGKVNMDRNAPEELCDPAPAQAALETRRWIEASLERFTNTKPILTPRFIPSCSDELMEQLSLLRREYGLPVQSHLSENKNEIEWVKELCPWSCSYGDAYDRFGMLNGPTVMAHCVHTSGEEAELLKKNNVIIAHCPSSNINLSSGAAPVRSFLEMGITVGLGTDIGAGWDISVFRAMTDAIQVSKLRSCLTDGSRPLTLPEVFYMGTKAAGSFFGNAGSFEKGNLFDALVLDDSAIKSPCGLSPTQRLERGIYLEKQLKIVKKYVEGREVV